MRPASQRGRSGYLFLKADKVQVAVAFYLDSDVHGLIGERDKADLRVATLGVMLRPNASRSARHNLEWTAGFGNRFGIVYVDFETLERTPALSAEWFKEAARQNPVV